MRITISEIFEILIFEYYRKFSAIAHVPRMSSQSTCACSKDVKSVDILSKREQCERVRAASVSERARAAAVREREMRERARGFSERERERQRLL